MCELFKSTPHLSKTHSPPGVPTPELSPTQPWGKRSSRLWEGKGDKGANSPGLSHRWFPGRQSRQCGVKGLTPYLLPSSPTVPFPGCCEPAGLGVSRGMCCAAMGAAELCVGWSLLRTCFWKRLFQRDRKHRQRSCRGVPGGISCSRLNQGGEPGQGAWMGGEI